jgi:hypothetical protein
MKYLVIVASLLTFTGCTTLQDAKNARGTGKFENYSSSFDNVWDASISVVEESKLDLVSQNKEQGEILAQKGMSAFSYGENVAVFVEEVTPNETKVEVVSKRALETNIVAKNWSNYILTKIRELLE